MEASAGHYEIHLRDYLYVLRKRRIVIILVFCLTVLTGLLLTRLEKVIYRAKATILIERENPNVVDFKEVMAIDSAATEYYQTQYQMLKARSLVAQLIEKENLTEEPYFRGLLHGRFRHWLKQNPSLSGGLQSFLKDPSPEDVFINKMLKIDPIRNSRLVDVSVLHPDPVRSAQLSNSLVDLYIKRNLEDRFLISTQAMGLISEQLIDLKEKVTKAEKNLQTYKEAHELVNIPSIHEKDNFLQDARLELVKIQAEESKLAKRYLPAHPKRIHIQSQIEGLQEKIMGEEKRLLDLGRVSLEYQELEREAESSRQIYKSLLTRLQETNSEAKSQASNVLIVDRAAPPPAPYKPKPLLNFMMSLFIGGFLSILWAFFLEYLDSSIKIPDDVEKALGLELLGIIPEADTKSKYKELFFEAEQHSPAAESIRALRTALLFKLRHAPGCRNILITSPNPEEGKTSISVNLAAAFQQSYLRVLLIEGDLRKPRIYKILQTETRTGLCDVLEEKADLNAAIQKNVSNLGFDFLSCGTPSDRPTELLGSKKMSDLLDELKQHYDIILIDTPPYLAVADVAVLSDFASAVVVIARHHKTDKRHLRALKRRFHNATIQVLGVVINRVSVRQKDYYYQQYYYYGYGNAAKGK